MKLVAIFIDSCVT